VVGEKVVTYDPKKVTAQGKQNRGDVVAINQQLLTAFRDGKAGWDFPEYLLHDGRKPPDVLVV